MNIIFCIKCGYKLSIPEIHDYDKHKIMDLLNQNMGLKLIGIIHKMTGLDLKDSKALYFHINKVTGHCHKCNNNSLIGENVTCSKCKSFNTNWTYKR